MKSLLMALFGLAIGKRLVRRYVQDNYQATYDGSSYLLRFRLYPPA
jgi:hypothetical protein